MKLLRVLVVLAVVANLAMFAWGQGYFGAGDDGREPQRMANQLAPEKLRIVSSQPLAATQTACRNYAGLGMEQLKQLQAQASDGTAGAGVQVIVKLVDEPPRYWVHLAPLANRRAAEQKAAELKRLGVGEPSLVEDGSQFVISLAMFKEEGAANEYRKTLTRKGLKSPIEVSPRPQPPERAQVLLRGRADLVAKRLTDLASRFPGANVSDCP